MAKQNKYINLDDITEEQMLSLRLCDLGLSISGTWLEECVSQLYLELETKGLIFKPECYLADEWLAPDKNPVVGIAFFLAHPALIKLEKKMMLEAEGSTKEWCMKLLRHEAGHAINYAYNLYRTKKWKNTFGHFDKEYEDSYRFARYSKNFVRHLEDYYAQYHPDEDFAETFAVWLTPESDWENRYKGWKALKKLEYMDSVMSDVAEKEPKVKTAQKHWHISKLRLTLKNYYKKKRHFWAEDFPDFHDENLKKIFAVEEDSKKQDIKAKDLIKKNRRDICNTVASWTGEKKYVIDDLIETLTKRSRLLHLYVSEDEKINLIALTTYVSTSIMNYLYTGSFRGKKK